MVRFDGVGVRYGAGEEILGDITFALPPASFHFLTGRSGAGKSTLLRLMYMAHAPTRGTVRLFGRQPSEVDRRELPGLRRRIGIVFQDFRLLDHLTAAENVALPLRVAGAKRRKIREHVTELLRWVGLDGKLDALPPTLSGGEQQRIAIARAVINRPRLLLADEPTGNVDDETADRLLYLFRELNRHGTTVVVATHSEPLVARFDFPRLHLDGGRIHHDLATIEEGV
ncbi:MAG: cell division ATP-binding protein FtsE [Alphaproteobacteria bacterium]|nr:cell division ATP-binding protein FtsE [Alphaproteobacteria bacterium]